MIYIKHTKILLAFYVFYVMFLDFASYGSLEGLDIVKNPLPSCPDYFHTTKSHYDRFLFLKATILKITKPGTQTSDSSSR